MINLNHISHIKAGEYPLELSASASCFMLNPFSSEIKRLRCGQVSHSDGNESNLFGASMPSS